MQYLVAVVLLVYSQTWSVSCTGRQCGPSTSQLAAYRVVLNTFWTRDLFPKHYPEWQPPAQWTKLIGKSHSRSYTLFRLGQKASAGVKLFSEVGNGELLEAAGPEVLDEFLAPAISSGAGRTEAEFFVDGNHSRVSLMSRLIPSPDWFIGIDSFSLCVDGSWLDTVTLEVGPLDAGTDNGFTFTAPNWATVPQGVIYRIASHYPSHPAGSFYYPYLKRLPPIATVQFIKTKEYELNEVFHLKEDEKHYELVSLDHSNTISVINNNDIQVDRARHHTSTKGMIAHTKIYVRHSKKNRIRGKRRRQRLPVTTAPSTWTRVSAGDKEALLNTIVETYHHKDNLTPRRKYRTGRWSGARARARDCEVGEWGEWGSCSRQSCDVGVAEAVGEVARRREVLRYSRRGGKPCPPLLETRWCGTLTQITCDD